MPEGPSGPGRESCQPNEPFLPSKDDELKLITLVSFLCVLELGLGRNYEENILGGFM